MKVWITKYALTDGIIEAMGIKDPLSGRFFMMKGPYKKKWFSEEDYFMSKQSAIKKAEEMRQKKIESLKKQIKKLEEMRFE